MGAHFSHEIVKHMLTFDFFKIFEKCDSTKLNTFQSFKEHMSNFERHKVFDMRYEDSPQVMMVQGVSHWNVSFDRNMQVSFCLKVVLECWELRLDSFRHCNQFLWNAYCAPLLDQIWITLIFIWFLLILSDFCLIVVLILSLYES